MFKFIKYTAFMLWLILPVFIMLFLEKPSKPPFIYHVDSWGGTIIGVVDKKVDVGESHTLVIDGDYFEVNEAQYYSVEVGDKVLGFLNKGE